MKQILPLAAMFAFLSSLFGSPLEVGQPAPAPAPVVDQDGREFSLADAYGSGPVLVYFYPKADTPGCTKQACSLRDSMAELQERGIRVVGVSGDGPESQKAFQRKHGIPFTLLADTEGRVMQAFGVPSVAGIPKRQAFLVRDGKIAWRDLSASTSEQAADVLAAAEGW